MEGYLKKKSPKTQGKHIMDVWQKRYFYTNNGDIANLPLKYLHLSSS